jgi:hypothetical protein
LQGNRLFKKIESPEARSLNRRINGAVTGHHDYRHVELPGSMPFLQQRDAIGVRHPDIEQHKIRAQLATDTPRRRGVFGETNIVAFVDQDFRKQFANADFVVNDQNYCHVWLPHPSPAANGCKFAPRPLVHF